MDAAIQTSPPENADLSTLNLMADPTAMRCFSCFSLCQQSAYQDKVVYQACIEILLSSKCRFEAVQ